MQTNGKRRDEKLNNKKQENIERKQFSDDELNLRHFFIKIYIRQQKQQQQIAKGKVGDK